MLCKLLLPWIALYSFVVKWTLIYRSLLQTMDSGSYLLLLALVFMSIGCFAGYRGSEADPWNLNEFLLVLSALHVRFSWILLKNIFCNIVWPRRFAIKQSKKDDGAFFCMPFSSYQFNKATHKHKIQFYLLSWSTTRLMTWKGWSCYERRPLGDQIQ